MPVVLNVVESVNELDVLVSQVVIESASEPGPSGVGVPAGGTTGQVLAKASDDDYDDEWVDQTGGGGGGAVDSIVAGTNIDVDATDPANPIVSVETLTSADISDLTEIVQDLVGLMFSGNTETGITVDYQDSDGTIDLATEVTTAVLNAALALKADLASPSLTGNPTAPTQGPGSNSTRLATTEFVTSALAVLIGTAPGVLDTLGEIADAINDDANLYSTLVAAIAAKVSDTAYAGSWNGVVDVAPSKNAVYDKIEAVVASVSAEATARDAAIETHRADTTNIHGIADTSLLVDGDGSITSIVALTQAEYDAIPVPDPTTHYDITDAILAAADVTYAGGTGMSATDVEAAIDELATEKANLASPTFMGTVTLPNDQALAGNPTAPTQAQGNSSTRLATTAYVQTEAGLLIPKSLVDAKGDLLVGTADNTVGRKAVPANGSLLTADSGQSTGWNDLTRAALAADGAFSALYAPVAGSVGGPAITIRKSADESVTSSTALQDDDHLTFAIAANEVWSARLVLIVTSTATTPDFKVQVTAPVGATGWVTGNCLPAGATAATGSFVSFALAVGSPGSVATLNGTIVHLFDVYVANSSTAGSVTLQWAQNTSDGAAVTLKTGSTMTRQRIA